MERSKGSGRYLNREVCLWVWTLRDFYYLLTRYKRGSTPESSYEGDPRVNRLETVDEGSRDSKISYTVEGDWVTSTEHYLGVIRNLIETTFSFLKKRVKQYLTMNTFYFVVCEPTVLLQFDYIVQRSRKES